MIDRIVPPALFGIQATVVYAAIAARETYMSSSIDATAIVIAAIAAAPPTFVAYLAYRTAHDARTIGTENKDKITKVGADLDGRMTQLLETTSRDQRAQGVVEGRGEQAQLQVATATPVPVTSPDPLQVQVVPADTPLPVVVVEEEKP